MIPPAPRRCGDVPRTPQEQAEEALAYIFEISEHELFTRCGNRSADPSRVLCVRCIARNALVAMGWSLSASELVIEQRFGLLPEPPATSAASTN